MTSFHDFTTFISFSKYVVCAIAETIAQDDLSEIKNLLTAIDNLSKAIRENSVKLYGVLGKEEEEIFLKILSIAAIDAVWHTRVWQTAFRLSIFSEKKFTRPGILRSSVIYSTCII